MVRVTRLRHSEYMYLNPDLIERVEGQHQTVVHMSNGVEYVVVETPEEIISQVVALRVQVIVEAASALSASPASVAAALVAFAVSGGAPAVAGGEEGLSEATGERAEAGG